MGGEHASSSYVGRRDGSSAAAHCTISAATFYSAAKTLLAYIDVPMHTVPLSGASQPHRMDEDDEDMKRDSRPSLDARLTINLGKRSTTREVVLMSAVVVLAKMRFGLDGEER